MLTFARPARHRSPPSGVGAASPPVLAPATGGARPSLIPALLRDLPIQRAQKTTKGNKTKKKAKVKARSWYDRRHATAYGYSNSRKNRRLQGPHFIPHVAKRVMAERAMIANPLFDPSRISSRSSLLPSPGQSRKLFSQYERNTGVKIPLSQKKAHDRQYKRLLEQRHTGKTSAVRSKATAKAMEMNPMTTYAHGTVASQAEIGGKGERESTVTPDIELMEGMTKGGPVPKFAKVDFGPGGFDEKHRTQMLRHSGKISKGEEDLSELELSSDDEYDD